MRFVVKEFQSTNINNFTERVIGIGIKDFLGIVFPSPLSNFIKSEFANKGQSLNSQRNAAYAITRFLNFLSEQNRDSIPSLINFGIKGLTLEHGAKYISKISIEARANQKQNNYVRKDIHYINTFYYWLLKQDILLEKFKTKEIDMIYKNQRNPRKVKCNVFELNDIDVILPYTGNTTEGKLRDFPINKEELIPIFLKVTRDVSPDIRLGVALQFLGGLRRSEVVNLKQSSLDWSSKTLLIKIRDNQSELFNDYLNHSDIQVKNPRDQLCLRSDILRILYEEHMNFLNKLKNKKTNGLFISNKTKSPITGKAYSAKFNKVKNAFFEELLKCNMITEYTYLSSKKWSTHIGRGIFTNLLMDIGLNTTAIAIARGDKDINSSKSYVDEFKMLSSINVALNNVQILI